MALLCSAIIRRIYFKLIVASTAPGEVIQDEEMENYRAGEVKACGMEFGESLRGVATGEAQFSGCCVERLPSGSGL
jgi:hypothetical protein